MIESKNELLECVERGYAEFSQFVIALDAETIVARQGGQAWSIKDVVAHVAVWENVLLRYHLSGETFEDVVGVSGAVYRVTPFDEINQHLFESCRDLSLAEIFAFAETTHRILVEQLAQLSDDDLRAPSSALVVTGLEAEPLANYIVANTVEHYSEHLAAVRRLSDRAG